MSHHHTFSKSKGWWDIDWTSCQLKKNISIYISIDLEETTKRSEYDVVRCNFKILHTFFFFLHIWQPKSIALISPRTNCKWVNLRFQLRNRLAVRGGILAGFEFETIQSKLGFSGRVNQNHAGMPWSPGQIEGRMLIRTGFYQRYWCWIQIVCYIIFNIILLYCCFN